jgi:hypothetical protein
MIAAAAAGKCTCITHTGGTDDCMMAMLCEMLQVWGLKILMEAENESENTPKKTK